RRRGDLLLRRAHRRAALARGALPRRSLGHQDSLTPYAASLDTNAARPSADAARDLTRQLESDRFIGNASQTQARREAFAEERGALALVGVDALLDRAHPLGLGAHRDEALFYLPADALGHVARAIVGDARELHRRLRRGRHLGPLLAQEV